MEPRRAWKTTPFQRWQVFLQRLARILVPEEAGVGEAGAQHPLVASADDGATVRCLGIGDHDERGGGRKDPTSYG